MERNTTSTVLQILTLLVSLVSAIGVLVVNSKVDQLTGQVRALQELLVTHIAAPGLHSNRRPETPRQLGVSAHPPAPRP